MNRSIPTLVAALALTAACQRQEPRTATTQATSAVETTAAAASSIAQEDKEFMTKAAQGSLFEVTLGREVARRAKSPDVRSFAQRMVADHGRANDELKQLASNKGVKLPTTLDEDHREDLQEITKLSGEKLDREYMDEMVEEHEDDVEAFRKASKEAKDPDLRNWAGKTLPVLEGHLKMAKDLKSRVGA